MASALTALEPLASKIWTVLHPLTEQSNYYCALIPNFLSPEECRDYIALSEARGFAGSNSDYPPSYRNNERLVIDDPALANRMFARLAPYAPDTIPQGKVDSAEENYWHLESINERFRFCRYRQGQQFNIHQDGVHHRGDHLQSCLTFMIYLTDGDEFEGGDTIFYSAGPGGDDSGQAARVIGRVRPQAGSLILFDHTLWHAGEIVTSGIKHILRSDVMYRRLPAKLSQDIEPLHASHRGYVWTLASLDNDAFASGGRDCVIRIWDKSGQPLQALTGHTQSVLGLAVLADKKLASVSRDRTLRFWNIANGCCERSVTAHQGAVLAVASLSNRMIATGGADALVKLWNIDGELLAILEGHAGWVWAVASLENSLLASASEDGSVRLWDCCSGQCIQTLSGTVPLRALAISDDSKKIVTGNIEGEIVIWNLMEEGWIIATRFNAHTTAIRKLRFFDAELLASAGEDNWLRIWDLPECVITSASKHDNFVTDMLAINEGYISCSYDGKIKLQAPMNQIDSVTNHLSKTVLK